jgi:hypothetical protein
MPSLASILPIVTGVTGVVFLGGGVLLGSRSALARAAEDATEKRRLGASPPPLPLQPPLPGGAAAPASLRALAAHELPGGLRLGTLGVKAFAYGTALCLGGAGAAALLTAWALDVRDLQGFAARMHQLMPGVRESMERGLEPVLGGVTSSGRAVARATDASLGSAVRAYAPRVTGADAEAELAGLNSRERKAVGEFYEWLGEAAPEGGGSGGGGAGGGGAPQQQPGAAGTSV